MARLSNTYRAHRRHPDAVVMLPRIIGENADRLGHRYDIDGSRLYGVNAPPMNGARECGRRKRQMGLGYVTVVLGDPDAIYVDGERHVTCEAEPRRLAASTPATDVASVQVEAGDQPVLRLDRGTRKPLTQEQRDRKNEQERLRRAAKREAVA